ncbi:hypothetical protein SAMN05444008_11287 [Cnuella takakiae]|uniref:Uncharacterized protein n=1 Tax=Cnuella takakiae TaxID=1302690 RepID=A0A1M5EKK1_9BACT|nr:hypothetical protein [Cnuella takakiae]OLY91213.1 hypothetical protein BUE76_04335 [Cnuella takakiae]SHF79843.1 hypothetical protein SAMN05444008_11287 [Cnuella takakiae]
MPNVDEYLKDYLQQKHIILNIGYTISHAQLKDMLLDWAAISATQTNAHQYKYGSRLPLQGGDKDKPAPDQ